MPELRQYQQEDVNFLVNIKRGGCFNEMRTGKTPTALKVAEAKQCKKVLIICPATALYQWSEEYTLWLNKPCLVLEGYSLAKREKLLEHWTDGLVVSYDTFKKVDAKEATATKKEFKGRKGMVEQILALNPDIVILDEAHRIKNPKSAAAKAAFLCRKVYHRLALTGTPAPNKAHEVWGILNWLQPDKFTSYWQFQRDYFKVIKRKNSYQQTYIEIGDFLPGKAKELQLELTRFTTQRKRLEVMPWLPQKDYIQVKLPATKEQKKYLDELREFFETENIIVQGVLDRLIRERQIALHPAILGLKGKSPKLDWIKQFILDYPDKPILIFSKFTTFINILVKELEKEKKGVIVGATPIEERNKVKKAFQNGKINILILQIDTGKEALTLDRAEAVIFTDKYPPASDIQQAEDRFVATTEDKADKPHTIYELMIKGTYDEKLYELIKQNISETDLINDYKKYLRGEN